MNRFSTALLGSLVLCLSLVCQADDSLLPPGAQSKTLENGMRVVVVPTDTKDVVALQIVMAVGSRNEVEAGKSGFAHFFEHLMFRGTDRFPPDEAQEMLKEAGVASNAWTWDDQTVYHKVFLKEDLDRILDYESDRFRNLKYAEPEFRTESLAVLGEYNKNSADPSEKMFEVLQDTAYDQHTYKHTTMGFLEDIEKFPEGYEYSWTFFKRFYRPEYATLLLVGDVDPESAFVSVEKYFGQWERGDYRAELPVEPSQTAPRKAHIEWDSPTLPWVMVGYKAPPYANLNDTAAMQVWESLAFSKTSELYQELVLEEQIVDEFEPFFWLKKDPYLVGLAVRVTDPDKMDEVKKRVVKAFEGAKDHKVTPEKLSDVKSRVIYSFLHSLDSPDSIASNLAFMLSLNPTLESVDDYYEAVGRVTTDQLEQAAETYFRPEGRTVITLQSKEEKDV
jgi:zinc protease